MSKSKTPFKGFLLKAANVASNKIMGSFTILESGPKTSAQYLNCTNPQSAITHINNQQKLLQTVEWRPPSQFTGSVVMVATVVKDFDTYWVNITSDTIMVGDVANKATMTFTKPSTICLIICVLIMTK